MTFKPISVIKVFLKQENETIAVGRLVLNKRKIFFEYFPEFITSGIEISPFYLPLKPGVHTSDDFLFEGLFGVFNDSLPDGWGRLLLDRKLTQLGVNPGSLSPLDRLSYVGSRGMGALIYLPEIEGYTHPQNKNLDAIAEEAYAFQKNNDDTYIDELSAMNGSSAGARPKVMVNIDKEEWIIKFRSSADPLDIGLIEYAYHLMAQEAGLDVPEARIFPSKTGLGYFGVKRFDRHNSHRIHMHTMSGLLHVDHRLPNLDYDAIMRATAWLTKDSRECEKQFRAAVFNVLSHNRDDHAKNFSFLMNGKGSWRVSPAYDLTFSSGPSGEHSTMIMGEGKRPQIIHLLKLASLVSIKEPKAMQIIDHVKSAITQWEKFAKNLAISHTSNTMILKAMQNISKNFTS